jgi:alpha-N-arabinofuranosidase
MYKVFQGATEIPLEVEAATYSYAGVSVPAVSATAGRDAAGTTHLGLVNLDPDHPTAISVKLEGLKARMVTGQVLTAPQMDARNRFDAPNLVKPAPFNGARLAGDTLSVTLPAKSVTVLDLR